MNKSELVDAMVSDRPLAIASKTSISKKTADATLTSVLEVIVEAVTAGDKVTLVGFGSFESRQCQAREGRNSKTGNKMQIPATQVPAFSATKCKFRPLKFQPSRQENNSRRKSLHPRKKRSLSQSNSYLCLER